MPIGNRQLAAFLFAVALSAGTPTLLAQEAAPIGAVTGRVLETDGTPVPGVFVLLEGPAPAHDQRRVRADADARFTFDAVVPGVYGLAVELPGLAAAGNMEVVVAAGEVVEANAVLSLFAYDVEVQVVGRAPRESEVFDAASVRQETRLDRPMIAQLPLEAEQVLEALPVLPGIVRGPTGLVSIGGNLPSDSAFLFNGADLIDPYSGEYRMQIPLEAVDNVQLTRGAYAAGYGDSLGGVVDVTTAGAGDRWESEIASIFPRPWLRGGRLQGIRRFQPRFRFGGPLIPGELYFSQSFAYSFNRERVEDVPGERGDHIRQEGLQSLTQIDWRPERSAHRLSLMLLAFPESEQHAGLSGLVPVEATSATKRDAATLLAEHRYRMDEVSALTTTIQINRVGFVARPEALGEAALQVLPDRFDGAAFHREDRRTRHWQIRTAYSRAFGGPDPRHLLTAGIDAHGLSTSGTVANDPIEVLAADGRLLSRTTFVGDGRLRGSKRELALFVQDRFRPSPRLWLDAGVRLSYDGAARSFHAAPRGGLAWDLRGDTRTLLKASTGLLYRRVFLGEMLWEQQLTRVETTFDGDGGALSQVFRPTVADGFRPPRAWVATVELSHRVSDSLTLLGRVTRRDTRDRAVFDLVPGDAISHDAAADPLAIASGLAGIERGQVLLRANGASRAHELEVSAAWRSEAGHQLFLSYVRSRARGDLNDFGRLASTTPDAILRPNAYARLPFEAPDRVVLWGRIYLPWDLIAAPVLEYRSGFPWSVLDEDQGYAGDPATRRFPSYFQADINVTKGFSLGDRQLRLGLQLRNLTNRFNPRDVIANTASDRFGEFLNSSGLRLRFRSSASF